MNSLITTNEYAAFEKVAAEESGGRILKFSKDGHWVVGVDEEKHDGEQMLADVSGLTVGWRKWREGKIVDINMGYVSSGFQPKNREELDDADETAWPKNSRGEVSDPWQFGYHIRLSDEGGQVYTWSATSAGAKRAIGDLCRQFAHKRTNPFVKLSASNYRHREYGKINTPELTVVDWADQEPRASAKPALTAVKRDPPTVDFDDVPF